MSQQALSGLIDKEAALRLFLKETRPGSIVLPETGQETG